jgi:hypothetical protein
VKFGVMYNTGVYGVDPDAMIAVARYAEDCGFDPVAERRSVSAAEISVAHAK